MSIEDTKAAKSYYDKGLSVDNRKNYKILWGLGNILMKQEKFHDALKYFELANQVNPYSSSIHTYLGLTYKHLEMFDKAVQEFERAEDLASNQLHNRFH